MRGYPIQAFGSGDRPIGRIGRLIDPPADMGDKVEPIPFPDDQWHTIEITAINNQVASSVDGTGADLEVDADARYMSGAIALLSWANAQIQIKEILIRELPDDSAPQRSARPRTRDNGSSGHAVEGTPRAKTDAPAPESEPEDGASVHDDFGGEAPTSYRGL